MLGNSEMQNVEAIKNLLVAEEKPQEEAPKPEVRQPIQEPQEPADTDGGADEIEDEIDLSEGEEGNTGPDDTEQRAPAIDPPAGLTADEIDVFRNSPPEVQKAWARRDQSRLKEIRRMQNEHAEKLKEFEKDREALTAERTQVSQAIARYVNPLVAAFQKDFGDVKDPVALATNDPVRFTQFQARIAQIQTANIELAQAQEAERVESQQRLAKFRDAENQKIVERLNLDTKEKFDKWDSEITEYGRKLGFTDEQLYRTPAEGLLVLQKAMKYDRAMEKRKERETKSEPPPKFVKAGVKSELTSEDEARTAHMKRLRKTGDVKDAAALIKGML